MKARFKIIVLVVSMQFAWMGSFVRAKLTEPEAANCESEVTQPFLETADATQLPPLPIEVTSFGACRSADSIYVFGGHTGSAHTYFNQSQNENLLKLDLSQPKLGWQKIGTGPRLQGLGMVAHQNRIVIVGGFSALNAEGQEQNLRSQNQVQAFRLDTKSWQELAPLPEPRSSHDVALLGNTIYVVGGWNLQGSSGTTWHHTAWAMDLSNERATWKEIAKPPFSRRALATVAHEGKIFAIGGMNEKGGPTREVSIYDPAANTWSQSGPLIGEKDMAGFGAAAWSVDGKLVVSTQEGSVQAWNPNTNQFAEIGKTKNARFFHRLIPLNQNALLAIGGANMGEGKYTELETITVTNSNTAR